MSIAGLAFSIPFELAVGPFAGYFIGKYLRDIFGLHRYIVYVFILLGIAAGIFSVVMIIRMMVKINRADPDSREAIR